MQLSLSRSCWIESQQDCSYKWRSSRWVQQQLPMSLMTCWSVYRLSIQNSHFSMVTKRLTVNSVNQGVYGSLLPSEALLFWSKKCGDSSCIICFPLQLPEEQFAQLNDFPDPVMKDDGHYKPFAVWLMHVSEATFPPYPRQDFEMYESFRSALRNRCFHFFPMRWRRMVCSIS